MLKKNAPNQADNFAIFQSCLLPKMRLSVVLEGRYTGYKPLFTMNKGFGGQLLYSLIYLLSKLSNSSVIVLERDI